MGGAGLRTMYSLTWSLQVAFKLQVGLDHSPVCENDLSSMNLFKIMHCAGIFPTY